MRARHLALFVVGLLGTPRAAHAQANLLGQWSSTFPVAEQATHCGVLRGQGDTTVVLYLDRNNSARAWIWNPANPVQSKHVAVPSPYTFQREGGHTMLADGRYLLIGGYGDGGVGIRNTSTFDPKRYWQPPAYGWATDDAMRFGRGSPTAVPMPDGSVLAFTGADHHSAPIFGGASAGGPVADFRELATGATFRWASRPNPNPAPAREGASLTPAFRQFLSFGGRDAVGPRNDSWLVARTQTDQGVSWAWQPVLLVPGFPAPAPRSDHGALSHIAFCDSLCDTVWVFGGRGSGGQVFGDVWRLVLGNRAQNRYRWESVSVAGVGPGPRHGHTCSYDAGPPGAVGYPRMIVFGGRDSTGALCDNRAWAMTLRPPYRWSALTTASASPAPRTQHVGYLDLRSRFPVTKPKRLIVFGGEGASGALGDTWFLYRNNVTAADTTYTWTANPTPGPQPPARARAAYAYDEGGDRVLVWSGDADGGDASSGLLSDLWALGPSLDPAFPSIWTSIAADSAPAPRAGAAMQWWNRGAVTVLTPERFDPTATAGSRWSSLDFAPRYDQYLYPFMMLTKHGKVLYAGIADSCTFLDPDPLSPTRGWGPRFPPTISGASAVVVRPDYFMKSGSDNAPGAAVTLQVDDAGATTGWQSAPGMLPRIDHASIVVPDGRVLVVGGSAIRQNAATSERRPQFFDPLTRQWSAPLAPNPKNRGYHSTSVLLPDARILNWGGIVQPTPSDSAEIYSPPYLFADASGTLAARPEISAVQDTVAYGQSFTLCACLAPRLASMALIRPGAPTHASDQNARFVPLTFAMDPFERSFTVAAPANANLAPPGDYMLFVVDSLGVPSISRWVHVRPGPAMASVACPAECVADAPAATSFPLALWAPRPNPSRASSLLAFQLPERGRVALDVLDVQGRRVRQVADRVFPAGSHTLRWDGSDSAGQAVRAGVYFVRLRTEVGAERLAKLVRVR